MEFLMDPSIWIGLLTLVVLEIVLGQHERPTVGESFQFGDFRFDVLEISNRRVELVGISRTLSEPEQE